MKKNLVLFLTAAWMLLVPAAAKSQSFNPFILSGRADRLATGDLSFLTPDLQAGSVDAALSYGRWLPGEMPYGALQASGFLALRDGFGIRFDYRSNAFSAFEAFDGQGNSSGQVRPTEMRFLAGVSFRLNEHLFVDVNGKYLSAAVSALSLHAKAFAGDLAVSYANGGLTLGLKAADLGTKYDYGKTAWPLPARILAGGSYGMEVADGHTVTAGADLGYIFPKAYSSFTATAGVQYAWKQLFFARAGYHHSSAIAPRFAAFGAGVLFHGVGLDGAWLTGPAGNAWTVTVKVCL